MIIKNNEGKTNDMLTKSMNYTELCTFVKAFKINGLFNTDQLNEFIEEYGMMYSNYKIPVNSIINPNSIL